MILSLKRFYLVLLHVAVAYPSQTFLVASPANITAQHAGHDLGMTWGHPLEFTTTASAVILESMVAANNVMELFHEDGRSLALPATISPYATMKFAVSFLAGAATTGIYTDTITVEFTADASPHTYTMAIPISLRVRAYVYASVVPSPLSIGSTLAVTEGDTLALTWTIHGKPKYDMTLNAVVKDSSVNSTNLLKLEPSSLFFPDTVQLQTKEASLDMSLTAIDNGFASGDQWVLVELQAISLDSEWNDLIIAMDSVSVINSTMINVTIFDNDEIGLMYRPNNITIREGQTQNINVSLKSKPQTDVLFVLPTSTEISFEPSSLLFSPDDWQFPRAMTVTVLDDDIVEGFMELSLPWPPIITMDSDYANYTPPPLIMSILDDDDIEYGRIKPSFGYMDSSTLVTIQFAAGKSFLKPTRESDITEQGLPSFVCVFGDEKDDIMLAGNATTATALVTTTSAVSCLAPPCSTGATKPCVDEVSLSILVNGQVFRAPRPNFFYRAPALITNVTPATAAVHTTTELTVKGKNFFRSDQIDCVIGGQKAVKTTLKSSDLVVCTAPPRLDLAGTLDNIPVSVFLSFNGQEDLEDSGRFGSKTIFYFDYQLDWFSRLWTYFYAAINGFFLLLSFYAIKQYFCPNVLSRCIRCQCNNRSYAKKKVERVRVGPQVLIDELEREMALEDANKQLPYEQYGVVDELKLDKYGEGYSLRNRPIHKSMFHSNMNFSFRRKRQKVHPEYS